MSCVQRIVLLVVVCLAFFALVAAATPPDTFGWRTTKSPGGRCFEWFGNATVIGGMYASACPLKPLPER